MDVFQAGGTVNSLTFFFPFPPNQADGDTGPGVAFAGAPRPRPCARPWRWWIRTAALDGPSVFVTSCVSRCRGCFDRGLAALTLIIAATTVQSLNCLLDMGPAGASLLAFTEGLKTTGTCAAFLMEKLAATDQSSGPHQGA